VSGYLFSGQKKSFKQFLSRKFETLIIPYLLFYLLTYLYWVSIERHFQVVDVAVWRPLVGIFYGHNAYNFMAHNVVLWFIPCLFVLETIFMLVYKFSEGKPLFIIMSGLFILFLGIIFSEHQINLPWGINAACMVYAFYLFGYFCKPILNYQKKYIISLSSLLFITIYYIFVFNYDVRIDVGSGTYDNYFLFCINAIVGTSLIVFISHFINKNGILEWIDRNTLVIMCIHVSLCRIIIWVFSKLYHVDTMAVRSNIFLSFVITLMALVCCIPFIYIYNKYINFQWRTIMNKN